MASDEQLMRAVADGDIDAFGEIVRRHQRSAWNAAWRLLGDAAEAEDAAQDAFLKILDAAPRYRPTASFRTYLYRVVTRLCLDRLQKKRPICVSRLPPCASDDPSPPDILARQEDERAIRRALDALLTRQRTALILRHFEDMSYQEIADAMDTSVKAVERLLALNLGEGGTMLQPMAVGAIGGLLAEIPVALFLMPCVYRIFSRAPSRKGKRESTGRLATEA